MNKKTVISMVVLTMMSVLPTWAWKGDIVVSTPKTSLVLHANEGGSLRFSYFGEKLTSN